TVEATVAMPVAVTISQDGQSIAIAHGTSGEAVQLHVAEPRLWTPEDPHLYAIEVVLGDDRVASYVGLRSIGVEPDANGIQRLHLNGDPYPHIGVLDQGYWESGLYTPPDDAALE